MDSLENAIAIADQIRDALRAEVDRARGERGFIRTMDVDGLLQGAAARAAFNALMVKRQSELLAELRLAARALGLREVILRDLRAAAPELTFRLSSSLDEARTLVGALGALDQLNCLLGRRALLFVRAYLAALNPRPAAYDRRGLATALAAAAPRASTVVNRVV